MRLQILLQVIRCAVLLCERLVEACAAGERRLDEQREDANDANTALTPEEIERVRKLAGYEFDSVH